MKSISFLEQNNVDVKKCIETFGSVEKYSVSLSSFVIDIHNKINELIKFMNNGDLANYVVYASSLKSDASYYGFTKLEQIAYDHEIQSNVGDLYYVSSHINDLIKEVNNTILLIQDYLNGNDNDETSETTPVQDNKNLGEVFDKKTILVVDDSSIIRNFVKRIFSDNYYVASANDGEEAINIIKANVNNDFIETILLDLNMPKVDGFAVLEYMKENDLFKKMPVSIISGDSSKDTLNRAFEYQIVDMLEKPFNDQSVKMIIEKTLFYKEMN